MPTIEAEPLVIAFKREVAKMRDRDAPDIEIQAMLEFVEQSIRWREEKNRDFGQRLEGGSRRLTTRLFRNPAILLKVGMGVGSTEARPCVTH